MILNKHNTTMNREIIFRGKQIDGKGWVEGDLIQLDNQICIATKDMWATEFTKVTIELECVEVIPSSVGQYTGLPDKNKKKIFEGDIFIINKKRLFVCYEPSNAMFVLKEKFDYYELEEGGLYEYSFESGYETIGNIHDNPELLSV